MQGRNTMETIKAVSEADEEIGKILEDSGWTEGDYLSTFSKSKDYFFQYDVPNSFIGEDGEPKKSRFAVWGFDSSLLLEKADDDTSAISLGYSVMIYYESPLNKSFMYDTAGTIEKKAKALGWVVNISSMSMYDTARQLRCAGLTLTKTVRD